MTLCTAAKKPCGSRGLEKYLGIYKEGLITIGGDNAVSLCMVRDSKLTDASKHIAINYHCIRTVIEDRAIKVQYILEDNTSDMETKVLATVNHYEQTDGMGMKEDGIRDEQEC